jgi:hypothetical protein
MKRCSSGRVPFADVHSKCGWALRGAGESRFKVMSASRAGNILVVILEAISIPSF